MPLRRRGANRCLAGFTLPEVVVALAILGILFATVFRGMDEAVKLQHNAEDHGDALAYLESEAARLRSLDWSALAALPASASFATPTVNPRLSGTAEFRTPSAHTRTVRLVVRWVDARQRAQEVALVTAITKGGIST